MVQSSQFDGFMPMWHHATCIMKKANQIKSVDDVEGIESLRWEDQQKIRKYVDRNVLPSNTAAIASAPVANGIELSQTSRATCKRCSQKITKGEPRISSKSEGQGSRGAAWHHANCFLELYPSTSVEKLQGWESLPSSDQGSLRAVVKGKAPKSTGNIGAKSDGGSLKESKAKGQAKRKIADESEHLHKIAKEFIYL